MGTYTVHKIVEIRIRIDESAEHLGGGGYGLEVFAEEGVVAVVEGVAGEGGEREGGVVVG